MLRIFIKKEKSHYYRNIIYLYMIMIFVGTLAEPSDADFTTGIISLYFWFELLQLSPFSLTPYFQYNHQYKLGKPSHYSLETNLKMLSIPFDKFLKYNITYNLLKSLPFLVLLIIFGRSQYDYLTFLLFIILVLIFSVMIPVYIRLKGPTTKIRIENMYEEKGDATNEITEYYKSVYPNHNYKLIKLLNILYPVGMALTYIGIITIQSNIQTDILFTITYILGLIGISILIVYTLYFSSMIIKADNEI